MVGLPQQEQLHVHRVYLSTYEAEAVRVSFAAAGVEQTMLGYLGKVAVLQI